MNKRWNYCSKKENTEKEAAALSQKIGISLIAARILANRNITDEAAARAYLAKPMSGVRHPFELKDCQKAAERIKKAIDDGEKITVYGDYDVDGITATTIMYRFLKENGADDVGYYIPNRSDEGYGINMKALQKLKKDGTSLIVTVDCGITAVGEVEFAKSIGLDVIITDHHTCKEELPKAYALVNPKQPDCTYPFCDLAGVGVAFKIILAITLIMGKSARECFDKYIDIVAIGTIADVVSLTDENRIFVANGLKKLQNTSNAGIKALFKTAAITDKPITSSLISFSVAPRINAAGRVGTATTAVELLVTDSPQRAQELAGALEKENLSRQMTETEILKDALSMIADMEDAKERSVFVLSKKDWHHGVIGIVASRIVDRFHKPTILISLKDDLGKGSGRSVKGFNLFDALTYCDDILLKYGGHELAAGLGLNYFDIDEFDKKINAYAKEAMANVDMTPSIDIDSEISVNEVTLDTAREIDMFEPFGMGNAQPVFAIHAVNLVSARTMGEGKHCRITVSKNGRTLNFVGFSMGNLPEHFVVGDKMDIAFTMGINVFRGEAGLQLIIKDARASIY